LIEPILKNGNRHFPQGSPEALERPVVRRVNSRLPAQHERDLALRIQDRLWMRGLPEDPQNQGQAIRREYPPGYAAFPEKLRSTAPNENQPISSAILKIRTRLFQNGADRSRSGCGVASTSQPSHYSYRKMWFFLMLLLFANGKLSSDSEGAPGYCRVAFAGVIRSFSQSGNRDNAARGDANPHENLSVI
jgi:hypothetical protein